MTSLKKGDVVSVKKNRLDYDEYNFNTIGAYNNQEYFREIEKLKDEVCIIIDKVRLERYDSPTWMYILFHKEGITALKQSSLFLISSQEKDLIEELIDKGISKDVFIKNIAKENIKRNRDT